MEPPTLNHEIARMEQIRDLERIARPNQQVMVDVTSRVVTHPDGTKTFESEYGKPYLGERDEPETDEPEPMLPRNKHVTVRRIDSDEAGTISKIHVNGTFVCFALELPWRDNRRDVSCIPSGTYTLRYVDSPKFGRRLCIPGVPARDHILIHSGNCCADTRGCILPGERIGRDEPTWPGYSVMRSMAALRKLEAQLPDDGTQYEITFTRALSVFKGSRGTF